MRKKICRKLGLVIALGARCDGWGFGGCGKRPKLRSNRGKTSLRGSSPRSFCNTCGTNEFVPFQSGSIDRVFPQAVQFAGADLTRWAGRHARANVARQSGFKPRPKSSLFGISAKGRIGGNTPSVPRFESASGRWASLRPRSATILTRLPLIAKDAMNGAQLLWLCAIFMTGPPARTPAHRKGRDERGTAPLRHCLATILTRLPLIAKDAMNGAQLLRLCAIFVTGPPAPDTKLLAERVCPESIETGGTGCACDKVGRDGA